MPIPVDTTGFYNKSVDLMNKYKDLNFVKRAIMPELQKTTIPDPKNPEKGSYMSHRMSYAGDDKEGYVAYPEVVQIGQNLQYMPGRESMEYAYKNKQAIPLGKDKNFAEYFTTVGYKYKFPQESYTQAMNEYINNIKIKQPSYKYGGNMNKNKSEIEIGNKKYNVQIAKTDQEQSDGLKNITSLSNNEGMLFVFEEEDQVSMWMEDTQIPLDIIFIDEDYNVLKVQQGAPLSKELITSDNTKYVLEVNAGSGIKIGDELDYDEEKEDDDNPMLVIGPKGNIQIQLSGGERVFSRENSKTIAKMSKKAYKSKLDKDYKALGKKIFKYIDTHNNQKEDFVEIK